MEYSFIARDARGKEYTITVSQDRLGAGTREDPSATVGGMKSMMTESGEIVTRTSKGKYQILAFRGPIDVSSDDPLAP